MARTTLVGLLLLVLLTACGGTAEQSGAPFSQIDSGLAGGSDTKAESMPAAEASAAYAPAAPQPAGDTAGGGADVAGQQVNAAQNAQAQRERLVIRTASLQLLVDKVDEAELQVRQVAEARGGFVISLQTSGEDDERRANITIKVPALRFDDAINDLGKLAIKVESREVQGQDVTDEFVDLESRLRNLRAVERRFLEFLEQSNTITESLQVNQQLTDIQGQIEQTQGRITFLRESAALSTINVSLRTKEVITIVPEEGWSPATTARAATKNLLVFGQVVADAVIVFAVWAPVWLPLLVIALWLMRRSRRASSPPAAQP